MNAKGCLKAAVYVVKKNMPTILTVAGVVGNVTATVWACKKTLNVPDIMAENDAELEKIETAEVDDGTKIKMKRRLLIRTTGKMVKNYAGPAVLLVGANAASGYGMHIQHERTAEAVAVAAGTLQGFNEYRARVKERYGEDIEKELYYNMKKGEVEETVVDEKGKEKTVKKKVNVVDPTVTTDYFRRYLTRQNQKWWQGGDRVYVEHNINMANEVLTNKLQSDEFGVLTINEVYEYLGFEKCKKGMTWGWLFDYNNPDRQNVVNITFEEVYIPGDRGTLEKAYALDFNIDGNVYEMSVGDANSK